MNYPTRFDDLEATLAGADPDWLTPLRRDALARFREQGGFPTTRHEEWKYTSLKHALREDYSPVTELTLGGATAETLAHLRVDGCLAQLVFVNGHYAEDLSETGALPEGVVLAPLSAALRDHADRLQPLLGELGEESHPFALLNVAFAQDGLVLLVPRGVVIEQPIHILHVTSAMESPLAASPRNVIQVAENAQATLIETYAGLSERPYLVNARTEITMAPGAHLDHYRVQKESDAHGTHISTLHVDQDRASVYRDVAFNLGGQLVRNDLSARLEDTAVETTFNGLYLARAGQHVDNHTSIDHAAPHCNSWELYKGILDDDAEAVFNGKVFVRQIAQRTDAKQSNMNLLLSDDATINTKPQLEIWADDVRCTHGATVGHLDEDALFYLRSRGLSEANAREMLIRGFAGEVVEMVKVEALRERLEQELNWWLPTRREA